MKKVVLSLAIVTLATVPVVFAAHGATGTSAAVTPAKHAAHTASTAAAAKPAAGKTHVVNAEFVSYDPVAKKVTLKDEKGETSTAPLEGKAVGEAAHMKAGSKVMVTCRDDASGAHEAVTAIKAAHTGK